MISPKSKSPMSRPETILKVKSPSQVSSRPQTLQSPKNVTPPMHIFIRNQTNYLGLFTITNQTTRIIDFFKKQQNFPKKFSLFKEMQEIDLNNNFIEANIFRYDEIELKTEVLDDQNVQNHIKLINCQKIGKFLYKQRILKNISIL